MTLTTLSLLSLAVILLAIKIGLILVAVVWAFGEWFGTASASRGRPALLPSLNKPRDPHRLWRAAASVQRSGRG